jgi:hypothetical protein
MIRTACESAGVGWMGYALVGSDMWVMQTLGALRAQCRSTARRPALHASTRAARI